jgi:hypothetical protein
LFRFALTREQAGWSLASKGVNNMLLRLCACVLFFTACVDDTSADSQASSRNHFLPRPPEEAFAACANSTAGATCAFDIDGHHVDGVCRNGPDGSGPLACAPNHPPPPPEAFEACASSTAGATCSFDFDGHHIDGTCRTGPYADSPLACAPSQL